MATQYQTIFLHISGGLLALWDNLQQLWSWSNVMTRYHEAYHDRMLTALSQQQPETATNIHETLRMKDPDALAALQFDDYVRFSFIDRFGDSLEAATCAQPVKEDYSVDVGQTWAQLSEPASITKTFTPTEGGLRVEFEINAPQKWYVCELNLAVWWEDRESTFVADSFHVGTEAHRLFARTSTPVHVELRPIRTVSNSENGIETVYQGMTILIALDLATSRHLVLEIGG